MHSQHRQRPQGPASFLSSVSLDFLLSVCFHYPFRDLSDSSCLWAHYNIDTITIVSQSSKIPGTLICDITCVPHSKDSGIFLYSNIHSLQVSSYPTLPIFHKSTASSSSVQQSVLRLQSQQQTENSWPSKYRLISLFPHLGQGLNSSMVLLLQHTPVPLKCFV